MYKGNKLPNADNATICVNFLQRTTTASSSCSDHHFHRLQVSKTSESRWPQVQPLSQRCFTSQAKLKPLDAVSDAKQIVLDIFAVVPDVEWAAPSTFGVIHLPSDDIVVKKSNMSPENAAPNVYEARLLPLQRRLTSAAKSLKLQQWG